MSALGNQCKHISSILCNLDPNSDIEVPNNAKYAQKSTDLKDDVVKCSELKGRAFLCFTKDVIDPHVVYII